MGQVQRREQQDIELWELYEEEERTAERTGTRRSGRNGYGRESGAAAVMSGRKRAGAQPGMETAAGAMGTGVQADMEMTESEAVKEDPPMKAGGRRAEPAAAI